jgi:hypothetical protein
MPKFDDPGTWESRYRAELRKWPGSVGIIAEGDSWFAFPRPIRTNLVEELNRINRERMAIWSLARNGDTAQEIMFGQQYERLRQLFADPTLPLDGFLFSAGGNDLVGDNLSNYLNTWREGMQWLDCLNMPFLDLRFRDLEVCYQRLADLRDAYKPRVWLFTHAYDWATPSGKGIRILWLMLGGWLKKQFVKKGIHDPEIQEKIVAYLLERFGKMQESFEAANERVVYVRTLGTLNRDTDWGDELHPTTQGFRKISGRFQAALHSKFPQLPPPVMKARHRV